MMRFRKPRTKPGFNPPSNPPSTESTINGPNDDLPDLKHMENYPQVFFPFTPESIMQEKRIIQAIVSKKGWEKKIVNPDIVKKWEIEMNDLLDTEATPNKKYQKWNNSNSNSVREQKKKSMKRQKQFRDVVNNLIEIVKKDFAIVEPIDCVLQVDNLIDPSIKKQLMNHVLKMESVHDDEKDWHPGSNKKVLDLVHPSMCCRVDGKTPLVIDKVKQRGVSMTEWIGLGEVRVEYQTGSLSWIPTDIHVEKDGKVKIMSYVNNVHPKHERDLYGCFEKILESIMPMFESSLTKCVQRTELDEIVDRYMNLRFGYRPRGEDGDIEEENEEFDDLSPLEEEEVVLNDEERLQEQKEIDREIEMGYMQQMQYMLMMKSLPPFGSLPSLFTPKLMEQDPPIPDNNVMEEITELEEVKETPEILTENVDGFAPLLGFENSGKYGTSYDDILRIDSDVPVESHDGNTSVEKESVQMLNNQPYQGLLVNNMNMMQNIMQSLSNQGTPFDMSKDGPPFDMGGHQHPNQVLSRQERGVVDEEHRSVPRERTVPELYDALSSRVKSTYNLKNRDLQIIIKLANTELSPDHLISKSFEGGNWHLEGMNEGIVATGIYYYSLENIGNTELSFRQAVFGDTTELDSHNGDMSGDGWDGEQVELFEHKTGFRSGDHLNQQLGSITAYEDRCIVFPNYYQHRVDPFGLIDPNLAGKRRILVFWLIDPKHPRPSTSTIPPQQMSWFVDLCYDLSVFGTTVPKECIALIASYLNFMTEQEARFHRSNLMEERSTNGHYNVPFEEVYRKITYCEH